MEPILLPRHLPVAPALSLVRGGTGTSAAPAVTLGWAEWHHLWGEGWSKSGFENYLQLDRLSLDNSYNTNMEKQIGLFHPNMPGLKVPIGVFGSWNPYLWTVKSMCPCPLIFLEWESQYGSNVPNPRSRNICS